MTEKHHKFVEGVANGLHYAKAYLIAYPGASERSAISGGSRLMKRDDVKEELRKFRERAQEVGGGALLSLVEKRMFLARLVRAKVAETDQNSDLWNSIEFGKDGIKMKMPDKLAAIKADNDLAGEGDESKKNNALLELLSRI